jgi:hypothetical protein
MFIAKILKRASSRLRNFKVEWIVATPPRFTRVNAAQSRSRVLADTLARVAVQFVICVP